MGDVLAIGDTEYINDFVKIIGKTYKIRDLGEANTFLGMEITRNRAKRTLKISQTTYISKMAERFSVTKNKPKYVPLDPNVILKKARTAEETEGVDNELYRSCTPCNAVDQMLY